MRRLRATVLISALVLLAVVLFNLFGSVDFDRNRLLPLLQRQGQWPHQHLMSLDPDQRLWVLQQVIESAGHACEPLSTEFMGLREDLDDPVAYHLVECDESPDFLIALVADSQGTTQVLDCRRAYARGLDCRRDWERMPAFSD